MAPRIASSHESKPPSERRPASAPSEAKIAEELAKIPYEPFLPVERKLIAWSLGLGVVLLVVLVWVGYTFFTG